MARKTRRLGAWADIKAKFRSAKQRVSAKFADVEKAERVMSSRQDQFDRFAESLKADGRGTGKYGCTPGTFKNLLKMQSAYSEMSGVMTVLSKDNAFYNRHDDRMSRNQGKLEDASRRLSRCEYRPVEDESGTVTWQLQGMRRRSRRARR